MEVVARECHSNDLSDYLYNLYKEKSLCDVDLISSNGHSFSAHKLVLGACSAYLHKMFMKNKNVFTIRLDVPQVVLQVLLDFSYTGQLFLSEKIHFQLRAAATFLEMYSVLDLLQSKAEQGTCMCTTEPDTDTQDIGTLPHDSLIHGNQQSEQLKDSSIHGNQHSEQLKVVPILGNQHSAQLKDSSIPLNQHSEQLKVLPIHGNQHTQLKDSSIHGNRHSSQLKDTLIHGNQHSAQLKATLIHGNQQHKQLKVEVHADTTGASISDMEILSSEELSQTERQDTVRQARQTTQTADLVSSEIRQPHTDSKVIGQEKRDESVLPVRHSARIRKQKLQEDKTSVKLVRGKKSKTSTQNKSNRNEKLEVECQMQTKIQKCNNLQKCNIPEKDRTIVERKKRRKHKSIQELKNMQEHKNVQEFENKQEFENVQEFINRQEFKDIQCKRTSCVVPVVYRKEMHGRNSTRSSDNSNNSWLALNASGKLHKPVRDVFVPRQTSCRCIACGLQFSSYFHHRKHILKWHHEKLVRCIAGTYLLKRHLARHYLYQGLMKNRIRNSYSCMRGASKSEIETQRDQSSEEFAQTERTRTSYRCARCNRRYQHYSVYRLHYIRHHFTLISKPSMVQYGSKYLKHMNSVKPSSDLNFTKVKMKVNGRLLSPKTFHKLDGTVDIGKEADLASGHVKLLSPGSMIGGRSTMNTHVESSNRSAKTTLSPESAIKLSKRSPNTTLSPECAIKLSNRSANTTLSRGSAIKPKRLAKTTLSSDSAIKLSNRSDNTTLSSGSAIKPSDRSTDTTVSSDSAVKPSDRSTDTTLSSERATNSTEPCIEGEPKTIVLSIQPISVNAPVTKQPGNDDLFECPDSQCRRRLISQYAMFKHLRYVHKLPVDEARRQQFNVQNKLPCEVQTCDFSSLNLVDMQNHVKSQHSSIQYNCTQCKAKFQVLHLLQRHVAVSHGDRSIPRKKHECHKCDKTFTKTQALRRHEYWKHGVLHPSVKIYECSHPNCTYKTSASSSINAHASKHRQDKPYTCEHCGMKLKTEISHRKHVGKMHLGIRPFLCQICGINFGEEHELRSHFLSRHTEEREFQCEYCPYATSIKGTFYTHLFNAHKVQAEEDKREIYKCPQCPYMTILHHRYRTHINNHAGKREYECKICHKELTSLATLRSHYQWKHSDKTYSCTQCEYQTKTKPKLSEHIRVQHQLKGFFPYKCTYCDFKCATAGNTRKHIKQVHKNAEVKYIKDDGMLAAARIARASGHHSSLAETVSEEVPVTHVNKMDECIKGEALTVSNTVEIRSNLG